MGRQWCRFDPKIVLGEGDDAETYHVVIGIADDARDLTRGANVTVLSHDGTGKVFGNHRLFGVPLAFDFFVAHPDDVVATNVGLSAWLLIRTNGHYPCTIEVRRGTPSGEPVLAGAGETNTMVEANPIAPTG